MAFVESFLSAAILGLGALLCGVALLAWRRRRDAKMAVLGTAFAAQAAGGGLLLAGQLSEGTLQVWAPLWFSAFTLLGLVLLYAALFARPSSDA